MTIPAVTFNFPTLYMLEAWLNSAENTLGKMYGGNNVLREVS